MPGFCTVEKQKKKKIPTITETPASALALKHDIKTDNVELYFSFHQTGLLARVLYGDRFIAGRESNNY